jgi:hypothetical protein
MKRMLATLAAQKRVYDPQPPRAERADFWPTLVCVAAFYPLTTRATMGAYLIRPASLARGTSGDRARRMRAEARAVSERTAARTVTETAAAVTEHLLERAALVALDGSPRFARVLDAVGAAPFWHVVRASFELHWAFGAVEHERLRALGRMRATRHCYYAHDECRFMPELAPVDVACAALAARALYEQVVLSDAWPLCAQRAHARLARAAHAGECAICLHGAVRAERMRCGHAFCSACIRAWLLVAQTCPTCRAPALACEACGKAGPAWTFRCCERGAWCAACVPSRCWFC